MARLLRSLDTLVRFQPLAILFLRVALFVYLLAQYGKRFSGEISVTSEFFLLAVIYVSFSGLILIDGFTPRSVITKISSIILFLVTLIITITFFLLDKQVDESFGSRLLLLSVLGFFATTTKKKPRRSEEEDEGILPLMMR
ncbi:hypothetical protein ACFL6I_21660 [candidate division KSB1 bacterium]